jgi:dihydroorotate dehydrogenase
MTLYERLRPILFILDAERAHNVTLGLLRIAGSLPILTSALSRRFGVEQQKAVRVFGLEFPNCLGLAAGYDKDGVAIRGLASLGFGHIELGTVTPQAQPGNARPRVFRLTQDQALVNRMGFPNSGAQGLLEHLRRARPCGAVLGVNIGKGVSTRIEEASRDYLALLDLFYGEADYLAVNVSSPNTPGLRALQERRMLERLLSDLATRRETLRGQGRGHTPILAKLSPDLSEAAVDQACEAILGCGLDGVIVANTTLARDGLTSPLRGEGGGLSGVPVRERSTGLIARIDRAAEGKLPIIGVGGIFGPEDAKAKLDAGASLVQIFTGLVYCGPGLPRRILTGLASGGHV